VYEGDKQTLRATKEIIVATGSSPRSVPGIEIDRKRIITSDEAIHLKEVPGSIVIMGSGAVGVEFASIFRRFGSDVTIVELLPRLVPVEDEAVSAELEKSFRKQGITSHTGAKVTSAKAAATASTSRCQLADGRRRRSAPTTARGDRARSGDDRPRRRRRRPADREGLHQGRHAVSHQRPGISAIGDVITLGTAASAARARVVGRRDHRRRADRRRETRPINYDHVPGCTYCDPEIGSVGLTESEAKARGYDVRIGTFPFGVLGRAKMAARPTAS
jgi:dihydrolipoamide dehydrogenase